MSSSPAHATSKKEDGLESSKEIREVTRKKMRMTQKETKNESKDLPPRD